MHKRKSKQTFSVQEQAGSGDCDLGFGRHLCDIKQGQQPVFGLPDLQSGATAQGATASQVRPYADSLLFACV